MRDLSQNGLSQNGYGLPRPGRPPSNRAPTQLETQVFILPKVADMQILHNTEATEMGRKPSPLAFGISTVRASTQRSGKMPSTMHLFQRAASERHQ